MQSPRLWEEKEEKEEGDGEEEEEEEEIKTPQNPGPLTMLPYFTPPQISTSRKALSSHCGPQSSLYPCYIPSALCLFKLSSVSFVALVRRSNPLDRIPCVLVLSLPMFLFALCKHISI